MPLPLAHGRFRSIETLHRVKTGKTTPPSPSVLLRRLMSERRDEEVRFLFIPGRLFFFLFVIHDPVDCFQTSSSTPSLHSTPREIHPPHLHLHSFFFCFSLARRNGWCFLCKQSNQLVRPWHSSQPSTQTSP